MAFGVNIFHSLDKSATFDVHLSIISLSLSTKKMTCINCIQRPLCYRLLKPLLLQLLFVPLYTVFLGVTARCLQSLSVVLLHFDSQLQALRSQMQVCDSLQPLILVANFRDSNIRNFCSFDAPKEFVFVFLVQMCIHAPYSALFMNIRQARRLIMFSLLECSVYLVLTADTAPP
jgi:hypothetical protein